MPFEKNHKLATGRPRGAKGKTPEQIRQLLQSFIEANISTLQAEFNKLSSDKKLIFFEKLLSHCLPKPLTELERLSDDDLQRIIDKLKKEQQ